MGAGRSDSTPVGFIQWLQVVWLGLTGLAIGSFLNVVIARVPEGQSIVRPGSKCPKCGHALRWYENIPLFSWLALRARCSNCRTPISIQYPAVELITSVLFLAAFLRFGWTWQLASAVVFLGFIIPLIVIDAQKWILPFELTLPGIMLGILLQTPNGWSSVADAAIGAGAGFLSFRAFEVLGWFAFRKEAMGAGDKFLVAMVGAFLSWRVLLAVIFLSSLQGAVFGLIRIALTGRAGPGSEPLPGSALGKPGPDGSSADAKTAADASALESSPTAAEPSAPPISAAPDPIAGAPGTLADPNVPFGPRDIQSEVPSAPSDPVAIASSTAALPPAAEPAAPADPTMSWAFLAPGLPFSRRLLLLPWSLFLQPIPDEPTDEAGEELEWTPGASNLPFGPWIGLAAIELMLCAPWLAQQLPLPGLGWAFGL